MEFHRSRAGLRWICDLGDTMSRRLGLCDITPGSCDSVFQDNYPNASNTKPHHHPNHAASLFYANTSSVV